MPVSIPGTNDKATPSILLRVGLGSLVRTYAGDTNRIAVAVTHPDIKIRISMMAPRSPPCHPGTRRARWHTGC
jgi:hypothetical protein